MQLYAQVVEPPVYTCGSEGTEFYSAAIWLKLNLELIDVTPNTAPLVSALMGALGLADLNVQAELSIGQLELYVDVARAQGAIIAVNAMSRAVTLQATPGVANLYLGHVSDALFYNRNRRLGPADVQPGDIGVLNLRVRQTLFGVMTILANTSTGVLARAVAEGEAPFQQLLTFAPPFPQSRSVRSSTAFLTNLLNTLVGNVQVQLSGSLGPLLDPLVSGTVLPALTTLVKGTLTPVLELVLRSLVDTLLETLGVRLGEADVTVFGVCLTCLVEGTVYHDADRSGSREDGEAWGDGPPLFVNVVQQGVVVLSKIVSGGSGVFTFAAVPAGDYQLVVAGSGTTTTPLAPDGFGFVNPATGSRLVRGGASGFGMRAQDFGLAFTDPGTLELTKAVRNVSRGDNFGTTRQVVPGEVLEYQLRYHNPSSRAVRAVVLGDTVPESTDLVQDAYGADGEVELRCPDGPTRPLDIGNVHYLELRVLEVCERTSLLPGESGEARFQVRVR